MSTNSDQRRDDDVAQPRPTTGSTTPTPGSSRGRIEDPTGVGTAAGTAGFPGAFVWNRRKSLRAAADGVSPGTWRGALVVMAWLAALIAIGLIGRLLVPGLGPAWLLIALAIMVPVAVWWPRRHRSAP